MTTECQFGIPRFAQGCSLMAIFDTSGPLSMPCVPREVVREALGPGGSGETTGQKLDLNCVDATAPQTAEATVTCVACSL